MIKKVGFYQSNAYVLPRSSKYVYTNKHTVRQYGSIKHLEHRDPWLKDHENIVEVPLISKLLTLVATKVAHLDPFGIGLSYEANKPGWNDACNGLPGLFGSGISEMIELLRLVKFLIPNMMEHPSQTIELLKDTYDLMLDLQTQKGTSDFDKWDERMNALESYRQKTARIKS